MSEYDLYRSPQHTRTHRPLFVYRMHKTVTGNQLTLLMDPLQNYRMFGHTHYMKKLG